MVTFFRVTFTTGRIWIYTGREMGRLIHTLPFIVSIEPIP